MPSDSTLPAPSPEAPPPSQLRLGPLMDLLEAQDPALRHLLAKAFSVGETNLVVLLAPNNTGKTNVSRALSFFLYGSDRRSSALASSNGAVQNPPTMPTGLFNPPSGHAGIEVVLCRLRPVFGHPRSLPAPQAIEAEPAPCPLVRTRTP
jgi:hypothetical protein